MYEDKKVSVVVPVFNCDKYLEISMGDILSQTHSNIELILVNDGSTDNSAEICKKIADNDNRVKLICKESSMGAGPARNDGITASSGDYIMFLDSDDRIEKNMIERLLNAIIENNSQVAVCGYETYVENVTNGESNCIMLDTATYRGEEVKKFFADYYPEGIVGYLWNKLYDISVIKNNNLQFPDMRRLQDGVFNVGFFDIADSCCVIEDVLYHYRLNAQTDMFRKLPTNYYDLIKQFSLSFINKYYKSKKIEVFFLNELGSCVENTFSKQWDMDKTARRRYLTRISEDAFFLEMSSQAGVCCGKYRRAIVGLLKKKRFTALTVIVRIKLFVKLRLKKLFYFLKRGRKK